MKEEWKQHGGYIANFSTSNHIQKYAKHIFLKHKMIQELKIVEKPSLPAPAFHLLHKFFPICNDQQNIKDYL